MSAWVLQLALLTASLRFANAQGDPLPLALVELVRSSPINSIEDLQLLLLSDSVEEDSDNHLHIKGIQSNDTINRIPRSLEPQPAQQALCKVRTEVLEVTRTMLDRRNANFLLWPPCVEVQRCSGCCNARTVQCMPTVTHTRYLQVMKIQYVNKQPHYEKAVISIVDHIECHCQIATPAKGQRISHKRPPHRRKNTKGPESKVHSKEKLHRQDEHKQHQKIQFGEGGVWPQKFGHTQTLATQTEVHVVAGHYQTNPVEVQTNQTPLQRPHTNHTGKLQDAGLQRQPDLLYQAMEESSTQVTQGLVETKRPSSSLHVLQGSQLPDPTMKSSVESASQSDRGFSSAEGEPEVHQTHKQAEETRQEGSPNDRHSGVLEPEGSRFQESEQLHNLQSEKQELLLLQRKLDEEKRLLELNRNQHSHHHYHHRHHQTQTTTERAVTAPPASMEPPPAPRTIKPPAGHNRLKKRKHKNRSRMSKAAMRAILM